MARFERELDTSYSRSLWEFLLLPHIICVVVSDWYIFDGLGASHYLTH